MQSDEDIGRMVASVPVAIGSAMEHFAEKILEAAARCVPFSTSRTLSPMHLLVFSFFKLAELTKIKFKRMFCFIFSLMPPKKGYHAFCFSTGKLFLITEIMQLRKCYFVIYDFFAFSRE